MARVFTVGDEVVVDPLPFALVRYAAYIGQIFSVSAVVEDFDGSFVYNLRKGSSLQIANVSGQHLREPDSIVRARSECVLVKPLENLFHSVNQFMVPLYQRKYCWGESQWLGVWNDVVKMRPHSFDRVVLYEECWARKQRPRKQGVAIDRDTSMQKKLVIVDGQQRITTACIVLACLRNALQIAASNSKDPARLLAAAAQLDELLRPGGHPILVPTEDDRLAFNRVLCSDSGLSASEPNVITPSKILQAKQFFSERVDKYEHAGNDLLALALHLRQGVSILHFELDDGNAVARFFEQLYQRSVKIGKMSYNNRPGVDLAEHDLLRNFLLGHFQAETTMAEVYTVCWLELERATGAVDGDMEEFDNFLRYFLASHRSTLAFLPATSCCVASPNTTPMEDVSLYGGYRELVAMKLSDAQDPTEVEAIVKSFLHDLLASARSGAPWKGIEFASVGDREDSLCPSRPKRSATTCPSFTAIEENDEEED